MIETTALPSIAKLFAAGAPLGETPAQAPFSAQFAQLLALQLGIAPSGKEAPEAAAPPVPAKPEPAIGKPSGKPGGKTLPNLPEHEPDPVATLAGEDTAKAEEMGAEASVSETDLPLLQPTATQALAAALLPPGDPVPPAAAFDPAGVPARQRANLLQAMPAALRLPAEIAPAENRRRQWPGGADPLPAASSAGATRTVKPAGPVRHASGRHASGTPQFVTPGRHWPIRRTFAGRTASGAGASFCRASARPGQAGVRNDHRPRHRPPAACRG